MLETHTISKIDVLEGESELNLEGLSDIILGLENFKSFDLAGDTSKCPDLPIINDIINEISRLKKIEYSYFNRYKEFIKNHYKD